MAESIVRQDKSSWCVNCGHPGTYHNQSSCAYTHGATQVHNGNYDRPKCDCKSYTDASLLESQRLRDHELAMAKLDFEREQLEFERAKLGL